MYVGWKDGNREGEGGRGRRAVKMCMMIQGEVDFKADNLKKMARCTHSIWICMNVAIPLVTCSCIVGVLSKKAMAGVGSATR